MGSPTTVKFDISEIRSMKTAVANTKTDLKKTKTELLQAIEKLRTDWNTKAGKEFFESVDLDWSSEIDKYCAILSVVENCLQTAINDYTDVESAINKINF